MRRFGYRQEALFDYNDLTKGILQAVQSISSYYVIGYYTTNMAQDGRFRRVKISLNTNVSASWIIGKTICGQAVRQIHGR